MTHSQQPGFIRRRVSLRLTLMAAVLLPIVGIMLAFSLHLVLQVERQVERQLQREMELVARSVSQPIAHSLEREREGSIQRALESAFATRRVYSAHVYDASGALVASLGPLNPGAADHQRLEEVATGQSVSGYERIGGREVYSYFLPLTDGGAGLNGLLQVTRHRAEIDRVVEELRHYAWLLVGLATALVAAVVLIGHQLFIGGPIGGITGVMRRIEAGERDARADIQGPTEIVALSRSLNAMVGSLVRAQQDALDQRRRGEALALELQRQEKLAAVGRLAAGVAHEMGSPLSVIEGSAQRALRQLDDRDRVGLALEDIRGEVARLSQIVRQLLTLGKDAAQQREPAELDLLCRQAVATVSDEARRLGAGLTYQADITPEASRLDVDPVRLQQALIQLLRNAVQAAHDGRVVLRLARESGELLIDVDDDGPGVPEDHRKLLFEPFFTTKPPGEGSGLGLAVAHSIVRDHGGDLALIPGELGGACFRIRLPLSGGRDNASSPTSDEAALDQGSTRA